MSLLDYDKIQRPEKRVRYDSECLRMGGVIQPGEEFGQFQRHFKLRYQDDTRN